jgi:hypothetical protein
MAAGQQSRALGRQQVGEFFGKAAHAKHLRGGRKAVKHWRAPRHRPNLRAR